MAAGSSMFSWVMDSSSGVWGFVAHYWWAWIVIAGGIIGIFIIRKRRKFPLSSIILERRGDDVYTNFSDKLGRVKEDGIIKWKFMTSKDTLPPENYEYV